MTRSLSLKNALTLLRIGLAVVFLAHALVRLANGTIPRFGQFLETKGLPAGVMLVYVLTAFEIVGSLLLLAGRYVRWVSAGFIGILLVGIVLIHASLGWFVGEHGTGGTEYSFVLIICFVVVAAADGDKRA
ncbi:MAG: DoxX family protein [Cytophagales bacterium]|nr:MAG: DoxX family protein [Cytophagales bacterium]